MIYLNDGLSFPTGTKVQEVSVQESLGVLKRNTGAGLPTSVLPIHVQKKLNNGEQISHSEMIPVSIMDSSESN